jgi:CBS domain-containing protein
MGAPIDEEFETDPIDEEQLREVELRTGLLTVPLSDLCPRKPITLGPRATVAEAVDLMNHELMGAILVTDAGILVGVFTERDVLTKIAGRKLDFNRIYIEDYMTREPETLEMDAKVAYALNMMVVGGFRHVPIVNKDHEPVGMISVRDIVEHIVEAYPKDVLNLPADPQHEMRSPYGG